MAGTHHQPSGVGTATQLEFNQAMLDFKVMFPSVDADVIEAVLRANNGAVDATIDHLLAMSESSETNAESTTKKSDTQRSDTRKSDTPPSYSHSRPPHFNPPSYQQATEKEKDLINLGDEDEDKEESLESGMDIKKMSLLDEEEQFDFLSEGAVGGGPTTASVSPKHAYSHPKRQEAEEGNYISDIPPSQPPPPTSSSSMVPTQQMLQDRYEENLRLREEARTNPDSSGHSSDKTQQYLEDERLALMMQNEEFLAELRSDRDFLSTLESDDELDFNKSSYSVHSPPGSSYPNRKYPEYQSHKKLMDEAVFREKLKTMGKSSKKKFTQLAHMFSRRKGAKQLLGHAPAPSKDNVYLNAEPLVDREFDNESEDEEENQQPVNKGSKKTPTKGKYTSFS